jgi:hypothetical protein
VEARNHLLHRIGDTGIRDLLGEPVSPRQLTALDIALYLDALAKVPNQGEPDAVKRLRFGGTAKACDELVRDALVERSGEFTALWSTAKTLDQGGRLAGTRTGRDYEVGGMIGWLLEPAEDLFLLRAPSMHCVLHTLIGASGSVRPDCLTPALYIRYTALLPGFLEVFWRIGPWTTAALYGGRFGPRW